jgi:hypothetical protein
VTLTHHPEARPLSALMEAARTMKPSEFCEAAERPLPKWFNLDVVVTSDEVFEVEQVRRELHTFVRELIPLAKRVRWAATLGSRMDCSAIGSIENGFAILNDVLDLEEIQDLRAIVSWLLDPDDAGITDEHLPKAVARCALEVHDLPAAVEVAQAESCGAALDGSEVEK